MSPVWICSLRRFREGFQKHPGVEGVLNIDMETNRLRTGTVLWIMLAGISFVPVGARAQSGGSQQQSYEAVRQIFYLTNQERAAYGLQPLHWDPALATAAAQHAVRIVMDEGSLSHQYPGEPDLVARAAQAGAHFQALAENIAIGPGAQAVERQWMNSAPHRANILDPQMKAIGIAVLERRGFLYAVEDFSNAPEALTPGQVERKVQDLLRDQGIDPTGPRSVGEQACAMNEGTPAGAMDIGQVKAVVRFQASDLSRLPNGVAQQLRGGRFTKAAVGSCRVQGNFTTYRVAVVLY